MFSLSYYCWLMADEERRQEFEEAKNSFNLQLSPDQKREQEAVSIAKMVPRWTGENGTLDSGEKLILLVTEFNSEDHRWYNLARVGEFVMKLRDYAEKKKNLQEDSNLRDSQLYYTIVQKLPGPVLEMTAYMGDKSEKMFIDEGFKVVHGLEESSGRPYYDCIPINPAQIIWTADAENVGRVTTNLERKVMRCAMGSLPLIQLHQSGALDGDQAGDEAR
ncbi:hypothetical protein Pmar_PMAR026885 [Perkinsus marinus ATCC 50983]|uniref:Uncharacterized protein n=1 Tax=Perkinsus marinus (strain ATCC 50983 / TXsc) TaxID=423536 RepID=C5LUR1_PERM5|nr:hypothetical protein Pmar_PMAR026885 [Perkinsus marinus ATCC 50983]EEQ99519.1 hypothetical protein Pmar_PMAR026885 [Perkinsus marinus ATCC 50983]|eukprot:XP_002766802.1 hypothetical protein Pmar_PMAR026885 [Perkinsus marinus ATCC 50983]